jgi:uncharacterized protein (TIGR00255 family)
MTGYGKAEGQAGQKKYTVEMRSLNSKQFDLNVRMPGQFREREMELRNWLTQRILRGKADVNIYFDATSDTPKVTINKNLMMGYYKDLKEVADSIGQADVDFLSLLIRIPDAMVQERQEMDEEEWNQIFVMIQAAQAAMDEYRSIEGKELETDFRLRIANILKTLDDIAVPAQLRIERVKTRLKSNLEEVIVIEKIDTNRFEQELIYYLEKMDITEEQIRLKSNCDHFLRELDQEDSQGKKLGFICQEIGREINTIGSKANDADMQRMVVFMKDELEKIKEQVLNVL